MPRTSSLRGPSLPGSTWACFWVFLAANLLLSYFSLPLAPRIAIGLLGLGLPFAYFLWRAPQPQKESFSAGEFLPPIPLWAWALLAALAVFVRFYKLASLSVWPGYDEGLSGFAALELFKKWDWLLLYSGNDSPRSYVWGLSLLDRLMGPSLAGLWLFPALVSLSAVPLAYFAARQFFSASFSFLVAFWAAGSFWPFYLARYSIQPNLVPAWACLCLWLLGRFLKTPPGQKRRGGWALGLAVGLGFYTYISFAPVAAAVGLAVGTDAARRRNFRPLMEFLLAVLLSLLPLGISAMKQGIGNYLGSLWAFSGSLSPRAQGAVSLSYLAELFWGLEDPVHSYRPVWGGFLNPIWGSLFLLGFLQTLQDRSQRLSQWLLAALGLTLFPALATKSMEAFRMVPALVVLPVFCVRGFRGLWGPFKPSPSVFAAGALLLFSFGLDFYHLIGPYQRICRDTRLWYPYLKSVERYRAYQILEPMSRAGGPGYLFGEFNPGFCDETLTIASYAFNAAENPSLAPGENSWIAVLANASYRPFLAVEFPEGRAFYLSKGLDRPNGGIMLWVMPSRGHGEILRKWMEADAALKPYIDHYISYAHGEPFQKVAEDLAAAYPAFQGSRFLESCFWEKMADAELKMEPPGFGAATGDLGKAVQEGYPSANLYHDLGMDDWMMGRKDEAVKALEKAANAPGNMTDSLEFLKRISK